MNATKPDPSPLLSSFDAALPPLPPQGALQPDIDAAHHAAGSDTTATAVFGPEKSRGLVTSDPRYPWPPLIVC
jgi:hypothetical protein